MNERILWKAEHLGKSYNLNKRKVIKKLLKKLGKGVYSCENEFGEDVILDRKAVVRKVGKVREMVGQGMDVWTFQGNGFLSMEYYNENGECTWSEVAGRYDL